MHVAHRSHAWIASMPGLSSGAAADNVRRIMPHYPAPLPSPDRLHASLAAIIKRCRADGRRSTDPRRTAMLRGEYVAEILAVVEAHIGAASISGGIHPTLAPAIRQWLQGRNPAPAAPAPAAPADTCPDCGQDLAKPARPVFETTAGTPVWCAYCDGAHPEGARMSEAEAGARLNPEPISCAHGEPGE
jgi:AcrR family transcriptional regulator